jgi:hypothetical protein
MSRTEGLNPDHATGRTSARRFERLFVLALALTLLLALAAPLAACTPTVPTETPGITGTVTSLVPGDERPDSILVESAAPLTNKAQVTIEPVTLFFDAQGKPGKGSSVVVGTKVNVWFSGAVAESYPIQGAARAIQVLGQ